MAPAILKSVVYQIVGKMIMKFLSLDKCGIGVVQWLLILLVTLVQLCSGANILVIEGMASPSHHVWMKTLSYALAEQGHNVTSLSSYMETNNVPANLHYLFMEKVQPALYSDTAEIDYIQMNQMSVYEFIMVYYEYFGLTWVMGKTSKGFQHLLDYPSDFKVDLIIIDSLSPDGFYVFAEKFGNPPLITAGGYPFPTDSAKFTGAPFYFSLIPSPMIMTMGYGFIERLRNFIIYTGVEFYEKYFELPATQKEVRNIIPSIRPLRELKRSAKINFVNYNTVPMVDFVQPILPNVIPVGGLQITDPKPLPSDLQSIYDDQRVKGVVVFSLGTNIRPEALGKAVLSRVLKYLGEISEYNFIWKLKASQMDLEVPKNVFVRDWLPQNDLLAQNRTVLFISHAGGLSTQETHWYGVPMLCVPGFFDQFPVTNEVVELYQYHRQLIY